MNPVVSILIPAYNSERWLADSIRSALAQTWTNTEVVVVDDGSKDNTLAVARQFESKAVKVIGQQNQGAAGARNTAFAACHGDYIQWLDADDILERDKVAQQVRRIEDGTSHTLLSGAWGYFRYRTRKTHFSPSPLWMNLTPVEWLYRKMSQNLHMQTDNWLVSRELTQTAGPWDTRLWRDNDGEYFLRVIAASDRIHFVPEARSHYRRSGSSSVSYIGGSSKKLESLFLSMTLHINCLRWMEDSERTRAACVTYISNWLFEFYPYRQDLGERLIRIAADLGGVARPHLSRKYDWIASVFGWDLARRVQLMLPAIKQTAASSWDRAMYRLENRLGAMSE
jgi:glycosyltransferase involved in cell wall biosynthesis